MVEILLTFQTSFMGTVNCCVHETIFADAVAALTTEGVVRTIDVYVTDISRPSWKERMDEYHCTEQRKRHFDLFLCYVTF